MSHPMLKPHQRKVLHASRMAAQFARIGAKRIEASLKKEKTR